MRKKYIVFLAVILILGLSAYSFSQDYQKEKKWDIRKQNIEEKAPGFLLEDLDGKEIKLSDYKGKLVLLVFSTTWCPYCRAEIPHLKEFYSQYNKQGFEVINIDIQESKKRVSSFVKKHKIPYKVLLDKDGSVARIYGVRGVPTKILIDRDGTILCRACRSVDIMLDMLLSNDTKEIETKNNEKDKK